MSMCSANCRSIRGRKDWRRNANWFALLERGAPAGTNSNSSDGKCEKDHTEIETKENSVAISARAVPIPEKSYIAETTQLDLVELAAILDQHKIWVESAETRKKSGTLRVNLENAI